MMTDIKLREDIEAELEFEPSLNAAGIGVAVNGGIATLTGHVGSYAEKFAAERAAGRVKGVRGVAEEIEVRLLSGFRRDDEEIARRAADLLRWTVTTLGKEPHVKVEKGWVTLTGEVDWRYQRTAAESAIRRLSGVVGLSNLITVHPSVAAGDVRQRITNAYQRNAEVESSGIHISVDGGKVTLTGQVKAWSERRIAEGAAWAVPGVSQVIDQLIVA